MEDQFYQITFDPEVYISSLIKELGYENEKPEVLKELKESIQQKMFVISMDRASMHIEPEAIDRVLAEYPNEKDGLFFVTKLIEYSAEAQLGILQGLDEYYMQLIEFNEKRAAAKA